MLASNNPCPKVGIYSGHNILILAQCAQARHLKFFSKSVRRRDLSVAKSVTRDIRGKTYRDDRKSLEKRDRDEEKVEALSIGFLFSPTHQKENDHAQLNYQDQVKNWRQECRTSPLWR